MNIKELIAKLPEADRADAEKAIGDAIAAGNALAGIDSKEKAAELIASNQYLKAAKDAEISRTIDKHDAEFAKEKLPGIVEAEIKKRNPEKDPLRIELDALKAEREAEKAELKRERLRVLAIQKAGEEKIPSSWIDKFISDDEDRTAASVSAHAKELKAWRDEYVEKALKERLGNNGAPKNGASSKAMTQEEFSKLAPKEAAAFMASGGSLTD